MRDGGRKRMHQAMIFQETLRRLAVFDEGLAEAGLGSGRGQAPALDAKTGLATTVGVESDGSRRTRRVSRQGRMRPDHPNERAWI